MGIVKIRRLISYDIYHGFRNVLKVINRADIYGNNIIRMIADENTLVYIAEDKKGNIVGTATLIIAKKFGGMIALIEDVAVLPLLQRLGIGSKLIKYILNIAKGIGCYKIILTWFTGLTPASIFTVSYIIPLV